MGWNFYNGAGAAKTTSSVTFVTSLPSSPFDGQEIYYQSTASGTGGGATNTMADVGAVWHLRYRAGSASSYKWEAVGAARVGEYSVGGRVYATRETTTSTTHTTLATIGPRVKAPLAGDYQVTFSVNCLQAGTAGAPLIAVIVGSEAGTVWSVAADGVMYGGSGSAASGGIAGMRVRTAAALDYIQLYYSTSNASGAGEFWNRNISITPIRVG